MAIVHDLKRHVSALAAFCRTAGGVLLMMATATLIGCDDEPTPPPAMPVTPPPVAPAAEGSASDASATYTVRGVVVALPTDTEPMRVRHEAIPNFRSMAGEVVGMDAMTMPFPLGDGVAVEGLAVDDKVELTFVVTWVGQRPWHVTAIDRLDPETPLDLP
jgi:Cu/Ag efflux protein CusF